MWTNPGCTGSFGHPTAPAGGVCLYSRESSDPGLEHNVALIPWPLSADPLANRYGFAVEIAANGGGDDYVRAEGTWAFRAP